MKKNFLIIILCFLTNLTQSQKKKNNDLKHQHQQRAYISLKQYKKVYKKEITKEDIANFIFKNGDTLVLVSDKKFYKNRVSVPYAPKDSTFLETYKDIVYQKFSIPKEKQKRKNYMRLWRIPIKIYFAKSLDKEYKKAIIKTAKILSKEVDSLNISFVTDLEKSNYIVYQLDDKNSYKYSKRITKNEYIDYYLFWKNNKIYDAKLEINLTKYKNTSKTTNINYINQVFFKSLGRFYNSKRMSNKSILSKNNSNKKEISKLDLEILKYHYSFGICKGTDLKKFEEQHMKAKEIFKKTGRHMHFIHMPL